MSLKVAYAALPVMLKSGGLELEQDILNSSGAVMDSTIYSSEEELISHAADADGILDFGVPISRRGMSLLKNCRGIVLTGHGFNHIDLDAATEFGIPVANVYFCHEEVATHSMLLLLSVARKLTIAHNELVQGRWRRDLLVGIPPIYGQTLGLIGLGHIGKAMARRARAFDLRVLAYGPRLKAGEKSEDDVEYVTLDYLLQASDFVSMHALLNERTFHMIGERELRLMKQSAYFVNTARGQLVDQAALLRALQEGWIAGAGLDVFEQEPIDPRDPILGLPNVVVSPHAAGTSDASYVTGRRLAVEKMVRILGGQWPIDVVNPEVRTRSRFSFDD